MCSFWNCYRHF